MSAEQKLHDLALELPPPPKAAGNYVAGVQVGNLLFLSGCGPQRADGSYVVGKAGADLSVEQAYAAARVAGLAMLARIRLLTGSLDRVARVVKVLGMVNAAPDFREQPKVINGFSDLMVEVFGEAGRGGRAAVGMAALTGQMAVEIEMVIELKEAPTMTENTDAQIRHIYEQWHETIVARDIDGLMALYAEDAVFESPLVLATVKDMTRGVLNGKAAIRSFFEAGFRNPKGGLGRWYRTGTFFANGWQLVWEYPRETPQGDQVDLVEVIDIAGGLIAHHRVYWGWVGVKALADANKPVP
jgi:enamine deaminase RidA (YjgF/YER057c/UK114 family)